MRLKLLPLVALLSACATPRFALVAVAPPAPPPPIEVQILAFNDFHGNIVTPPPVEVTVVDGTRHTLTSGGVARLAVALATHRQKHSITVSAGDLIGASPLVSAAFLDEPTIAAMNLVGLDLNAVGNHEFDKGPRELWRMQAGGCGKFTALRPCRIEPFAGAKFRFLAANVRTADRVTLFAPTAIRQFGAVRVGFIGMTLKGTGGLVSPAASAGLTFADEVTTANALVPGLKAQGADTIVLLIHQGGKTPAFTQGQGCEGLSGDIVPIIDRLDPAIATVVSGHTHYAYVCDRGGRLLTSAGKYGHFFSDLRLTFDPNSHRLIAQNATNLVTGTASDGEDASVKAVVDRYTAAVAPIANHVVGRLPGPLPYCDKAQESPAADLNADAFLAAGRRAGAQIALVNATGVRIGLPRGPVTYGTLFSMVPFNNKVIVKALTGAQVRALLEQQFRLPIYGCGCGAGVARALGGRAVCIRLAAPGRGADRGADPQRPADPPGGALPRRHQQLSRQRRGWV